jgi:hypothetical protein
MTTVKEQLERTETLLINSKTIRNSREIDIILSKVRNAIAEIGEPAGKDSGFILLCELSDYLRTLKKRKMGA